MYSSYEYNDMYFERSIFLFKMVPTKLHSNFCMEMYWNQGDTKRCRLSWLTNSALVYEPKCGGEGGSCGVSANEYSSTQEPKINFGDLTPYLTYDWNPLRFFLMSCLENKNKFINVFQESMLISNSFGKSTILNLDFNFRTVYTWVTSEVDILGLLSLSHQISCIPAQRRSTLFHSVSETAIGWDINPQFLL